VVGREEDEIEIPPHGKSLARLGCDDLDLVRLAALEPGVHGKELLDPGRDGARREQSRRTHRLELALAGPVGDTAEVVDVAVADHDRGHGGQRAVGTARFEGEMKLRQQDHRPLSGARSTDD
jgi:hypothetical protein